MPYPSLARVQYSSVRQKVDHAFIDKSRALDEAFYGTGLTFDQEGSPTSRAEDGWRHGVSHPFNSGVRVYDKGVNLRKSLEQFNKLGGAIWLHHEIAVIDQNIADGKPYGEIDEVLEDVELARDPDSPDVVRTREVITSRKVRNNTTLDVLRADNIEISV